MKKIPVILALLFLFGVTFALAVVGGGDITLKAKGAGDVLFSHALHVDKTGLGCKECHTRLYLDTKKHRKVTMKEMARGKSCGACHDGKRAFSVNGDCARCHKK